MYRGADISAVEENLAKISLAARDLAKPDSKIVLIKSTIPPGTTDYLHKKFLKIRLLLNPEFLTAAYAKEDFAYPDKQVLGYTDKATKKTAEQIMPILPRAQSLILPAVEAEIIKYMLNTYYAHKVVFANQIYDICESAKIDYEKVKQAVQADKRIGESHWDILHTESSLGDRTEEVYRGYGGKCFPKDINSLIDDGEKLGINVSLFKAGKEVNLELNGGNYDQ